MEKLKIVNPHSLDFGEALGIPTERIKSISKALDEMIEMAANGKTRLVYAVDIINHIRGLCNTEEEFVWAYNNHIIWLARTGRLFTTHEVQDVAIKKFGQPENLK